MVCTSTTGATFSTQCSCVYGVIYVYSAAMLGKKEKNVKHLMHPLSCWNYVIFLRDIPCDSRFFTELVKLLILFGTIAVLCSGLRTDFVTRMMFGQVPVGAGILLQ